MRKYIEIGYEGDTVHIKDIPYEVIETIRRILDSGGQAYIVGGALRDHILGKTIDDWDIATSLLPDEIEYLFSDVHTVATGKNFGTITVFMGNTSMELTTYRIEREYIDFRHPSSLKFTSDIHEDLKRRDFTMNALAFNPLLKKDNFIDPYGGRRDIDNKMIRAVGNPYERFSEDPLRMMRATRFVAELGFTIEDNTLTSIVNNAHLIENISAERIRDELGKTLLGDFVEDAVMLLYNSGLHAHIVPSSNMYLDIDKIQLIASSLPLCNRELIERLSAFFIWTVDLKDRQTILNRILRELRYSNRTRSDVVKILCSIDMPIHGIDGENQYKIRKLMGNVGIDNTRIALRLRRVFAYDDSSAYAMECMVNVILEEGHPIFKSQLAIDGHDIIDMGIGVNDRRDIGRALNMAYDWVLKDPDINKREILIHRLERAYLH